MGGCGVGDGAGSAACCCGRAADGCGPAGVGEAAGTAEAAGAGEASVFEGRPTASGGFVFGSAVGSGGGSCFVGSGGASAGETRSTVIGSAVTEPNRCTSVKNSTSIKANRWAAADAVMPARRNRPGFIVLVQIFDAAKNILKSIVRKKIPFNGNLRVV